MTNRAQNAEGGSRRPGPWRAILCFLPVVLWTFAGAALIGLLALISARFRKGGYLPWLRAWGRVPLKLCGVTLEVHGLEHRDEPGAKLILFNHVSLLDIFLLSALFPERGLLLYKKELEVVPSLGAAVKALGMISIDRENLESAIASVTEAGRRIQEEEANCVISPEGTRSRKGGLQHFKLGAFHLAAEHSIPIVPLIMRGIEDVLPMGSFLMRSGLVRVDYLPPIDTSTWRQETVREHAQQVREIFLEVLPAEEGSDEAP